MSHDAATPFAGRNPHRFDHRHGNTDAGAGGHERLASLLERRDVRAQLEAYGVNPADVSARVAALSDDEAAQLADRIGTLPTPGDGVGAVVGALLLVFIILLITDILGFTHVFPFTKPIKR
ncbi:MAG: hypothetical protein E6H54_19170 [Betaproteobacteria bacterium]|nr:MAG: hypothetical protein E6H54_19170 [Betaproteobacteria bacterium]